MVPVALAASLLLAIAAQQPQVHDWLIDNLWPFGSRVTVVVLPADVDGGETYSSLLDDVSGRIAQMSSGGRSVAVISPAEARRNRIQSVQQVDQSLDATHALTTSIRRDGADLVVEATVLNLDTHVHVWRLSARYSPLTVSQLPTALAGTVSFALRLQTPSAPYAVSAAAAQDYARGLSVLRDEEGGFVKALPLLEAAAQKDPSSPLPLAALVEVHVEAFRAGNKEALDDAQLALSAAETLNPDAAAVRYAAGLVQEQSINQGHARENFERVIELEPRNAHAYVHLARTYRELRMPERALAAYLTAIELAPDSYLPYHSLGVFYYGRGQAREAIEQFRKGIDRAPERTEGYKNLAAAFSDLGEYEKAESALVQSLNIRETASTRNSLGVVRAYQGRDQEALEQYRRAVDLDAGNYVHWLNRGDAARRLGLHEESMGAYSEGRDLALAELNPNPSKGLVRGHVAYFSARLGDSTDAVRDLEQAMGFSPDDVQVKLIAVLTYEALDHRTDALEIFQRARDELRAEIERHPDLADFSRDMRSRQVLQ
jgi:tetratricopeptide (TPR) repeat protein/TolB-like protein